MTFLRLVIVVFSSVRKPLPGFDSTVGSGRKLEIVIRSNVKVIGRDAPGALTVVGLG